MKKILSFALVLLLTGCNIVSLKKGEPIDVDVMAHVFYENKPKEMIKLNVHEVTYTSKESPEPSYGLNVSEPYIYDANTVDNFDQIQLEVSPEKVTLLKTELEAKLKQDSASSGFPTMDDIKRGFFVSVTYERGVKYVAIQGSGSDLLIDSNSAKELIKALSRVETLNLNIQVAQPALP